jgi:hypothetical protein
MTPDSVSAENPLAAAERLLKVPLKIAFTEAATRHFIMSKKRLSRIRMGENAEEYGLEVSSITVRSFRTMLRLGYIARVEVAHPDLLSLREEIIELTRLLFQSLLDQRFGKEVLNLILRSDAVRHWNRANLANPINESALEGHTTLGIDPGRVEQDCTLFRNSLLGPMFRRIDLSRSLEKEDKVERRELCHHYLDSLPPRLWTLIAFVYGENREREFLRATEEAMDAFVRKAPISEYLALMLVELVAYVGNLNTLLFVRTRYERGVTLGQLLQNPSLRARLMGEMAKEDHQTHLIWDVGTSAAAAGPRNKLNMSIFNRSFGQGDTLAEITRKTNEGVVELNLEDFLQNSRADYLNAQLGLSYLSYLREACSQLGIYFVSSVHRLARQDLAMISCHLQV